MTVSKSVVAVVDTIITVSAASAARAIPHSPSAWASFCIAVGATRTGSETGVPSTVVFIWRDDTSTIVRYRSAICRHAVWLSLSVISSLAPPMW